jgi:hypothetical protein
MTSSKTSLKAWIDLAEGLYEFLNRNRTTINYQFQDLKVSVPQSTGENSEKADWGINGTVSISTSEAQKPEGSDVT